MNNVNFWNEDPGQLLDFMIYMAEGLNEAQGKALIRTHFFKTKSQLLDHPTVNHMLASLICEMVDDMLNSPPPSYVKQSIRRAINDDLEIYIHVSDIERLGVLNDVPISKIKPKGLLLPNGNWIEMHRFNQGIAYSWGSLKTTVQ